ncbi:hypothetical protein COT52_01420 [candidate division WWE3 bacterium CG08_land_8_20_14_0_20_43_13]|uniref:Cardiolipin synthase N-terminal domain-containing protein n=1 Tax=candidate division WWE3 bacterium CG08_land_8_20_14_0_20_43_13 TaxID=1975087 RepID=A0A2H0X7J3_UNCKA|nr:MAG: hypothetical protein COT52_01420 [candidate division WWE3 bacterium CG08_land_8_20_14_0_20_43_13]
MLPPFAFGWAQLYNVLVAFSTDWLNKSPIQLAASYSAAWWGWSAPKIKVIHLAIGFVLCYFLMLWLSLVYWAWRDSQDRFKARRDRWLVIALIGVFNLPGVLIYLLIRPPTISERRRAAWEEELLELELSNLKKKKKL